MESFFIDNDDLVHGIEQLVPLCKDMIEDLNLGLERLKERIRWHKALPCEKIDVHFRALHVPSRVLGEHLCLYISQLFRFGFV